ncbi:MAG: hypothetical protein J6T10_22490 [Methanobrevibacter sp.]|nr:hypothetical protein [Methanobrevibacter sp.]
MEKIEKTKQELVEEVKNLKCEVEMLLKEIEKYKNDTSMMLILLDGYKNLVEECQSSNAELLKMNSELLATNCKLNDKLSEVDFKKGIRNPFLFPFEF